MNSRRKLFRDLKPIATTDEALDAAVDHIGLSTSTPAAETLEARAKIVAALRSAARTRSVTVMTATLHYQVDLYWEHALVLIDEDNRQILFATGGYGT